MNKYVRLKNNTVLSHKPGVYTVSQWCNCITIMDRVWFHGLSLDTEYNIMMSGPEADISDSAILLSLLLICVHIVN